MKDYDEEDGWFTPPGVPDVHIKGLVRNEKTGRLEWPKVSPKDLERKMKQMKSRQKREMKILAAWEDGFDGCLPAVHRPDLKILESIQNQVRTGIKPGQYEGYSIISIEEDTPYGCKVKFSVKTRTDKGVDVIVYTRQFDK